MGLIGITTNRALTRGIALPVGVALVIGVGASGAHAAPDDPLPPPAAAVGPAHPGFGPPLVLPSVPPAVPTQDDPRLASALARLDGLPAPAGPAEIAAALFPHDEALRTEAVARFQHVQASSSPSVVGDPATTSTAPAVPWVGASHYVSAPVHNRVASSRGTQAFPVAPIVIAAAAWCARGALASIPTRVLEDIVNGRPSDREAYVRTAVIGCLGGEIGGWAWRVLPGWLKDKMIKLVVSFIIRFLR